MSQRLVVLVAGILMLSGSTARGERVEGTTAQPVLVEAGEDVPPLPKLRTLSHGDYVQHVRFSPDGTILASASDDDTVRLWNVANGREIRTLIGHSDNVWDVSFSPDGATLASASNDKTVRLWDVTSGREIYILTGHDDDVWSVSFSPDGATLASASDDDTVRLWNVNSGREVYSLTGHSGSVMDVSFSPDGATLASASDDDTVRLWDITSGREIYTLTGHDDDVWSVSFSPDGATLASASDDGTVRLWNVASGHEIQTLRGHGDTVNVVEFSRDGTQLVSASDDHTIRLWDVASGRGIHTFIGHTGPVYSVRFSPDRATLASASEDYSVRLWEIVGGHEIHTLTGHHDYVNEVRFSPDGLTLASASDDHTVRLWQMASRRQIRSATDQHFTVLSVSFSPDGALAATSSTNTVRLWEVASGREVHSLTGHTNHVNDVSFSTETGILASASDDQTIRLWDVASGKEIRALTGHEGDVNDVNFSPDGVTLASASDDHTVRLWEVDSGREILNLQGHKADVRAVSWSPDGATLASASYDSSVRVWEVTGGREILSLTGHGGYAYINDVSFSPDGATLASASDDTVRLWEVASGQEILKLKGHGADVNAVSFSPDGATLASASDDETVRVWDVTSGREILSLTDHFADVNDVSFSPDGAMLASVAGEYESLDNSVSLWEAVSGRKIRTLAGFDWAGTGVSFSPDGATLASSFADHTVRLWEVESGVEIRVLTGHTSPVAGVRFSPDGATLASASADHTVRVWNMESGVETRTLTGHTATVIAVSFSPDGTTLASAANDNTVRVWDAASGVGIRTLTGHTSYVFDVSFSPDGATLASASGDSTVRLWNAESGVETRTLTGHHDGAFGVSFSPDGTTLASSGDNTVRLWEVASGREIVTFTNHGIDVLNVRFSPDGTTLALSSADNTVRLLDVASGQELRTLSGHRSIIWGVTFSPDGATLASASFDNTVRLWDLDSGDARWELRGLPDNGWIAHRADGKLFRGDDGTALLIRNPAQDVYQPLQPPRPEGSPKLSVARLKTVSILTSRETSDEAEFHLVVKNNGDAPALWVRAELGDNPPKGFVATPRRYRSRLDPGQEVKIPVDLSYLHQPAATSQGSPEKFKVKLPILVTSAFTDPLRVNIPVRVEAPAPRIESANVLTDPLTELPSAIQVVISNQGRQDLDEGISVSIDFVRQDDEQEVVLDSAPSQSIELLKQGHRTGPLSFSIPPEIATNPEGVEAWIRILDLRWPTHRWVSVEPLVVTFPWGRYATLAILTALLGGLVFFQVVYRNALVLDLQRAPEHLRTLLAGGLAHADRRLRRARALDDVLQAAGVSSDRWVNAVRATDNPQQSLATLLHADAGPPDDPALSFKPFRLPSLQAIRAARDTGLAVVRGRTPSDLATRLRAMIEEHGLLGAYVLVVDLTEDQQASERLRESFLKVVVIDERQFTALLLSDDPQIHLSRLIAARADLGEISPYKTSGGIDNPALFYGRHNELALLGGRGAQNHLLVGARQIGKTSLLKKLARQFPDHAHLVTLNGDDIDVDLQKAGLPSIRELGEMPRAHEPLLFLIDEADLLIAADRARGFPLCRMLRSLSERGSCRFVLAGFWELHQAAYLEHQSPIMNFAEPLRLGPLDHRSAAAMATRPFEALGIRYASDDLVDELLLRTGRRPNLVATACDAMLRALPALGARTLSAEILHAVLDVTDNSGQQVAQALGSLGTLVSDPKACSVDRMVMFATVDQEAFTASDVRSNLQRHEARLTEQELQQSLQRLTLAYVIEKEPRQYRYPVPLVRDYLLDEAGGKPKTRLAREVREWKELA